MRTRMTLWLGVVLACQGCGPIYQSARTLVIEPAEYPRRISAANEDCRNKKLAELAWRQLQEHDPQNGYSRDFHIGFVDGYTDYLYAGGTGQPPPVPPRCYWLAENESPAGRQAIADWNAGFRTGAAAARQSGYRELVTLPISSPPPGSPTRTNSAPSLLPPAGSLPTSPVPFEAPPWNPLPVPPPGVAPGPTLPPIPEPPLQLLPEPRKVPTGSGEDRDR